MKKILKIVEDNKSSLGLRFLNFIIDRIIIIIFFILFGSFSLLIHELMDIDFFINITYNLSNLSQIEDIFITTTTYLLYLFLMEYFTKGRTIGKYITGTKVISTDGTVPTLYDFFIRTLSRIVPFDLTFFLWAKRMA